MSSRAAERLPLEANWKAWSSSAMSLSLASTVNPSNSAEISGAFNLISFRACSKGSTLDQYISRCVTSPVSTRNRALLVRTRSYNCTSSPRPDSSVTRSASLVRTSETHSTASREAKARSPRNLMKTMARKCTLANRSTFSVASSISSLQSGMPEMGSDMSLTIRGMSIGGGRGLLAVSTPSSCSIFAATCGRSLGACNADASPICLAEG
mmetsp:Transcript_84665/g.202942  ORF Transcript_84665/g.202942 Transcript_84665/m.202942 type:complete len:210 (+) Transcript_84665:1271-1900(+)